MTREPDLSGLLVDLSHQLHRLNRSFPSRRAVSLLPIVRLQLPGSSTFQTSLPLGGQNLRRRGGGLGFRKFSFAETIRASGLFPVGHARRLP